MLIRDFVLQTREKLSEVYSPEESSALCNVLCTEFLGVQSYTHIVNPALELKKKELDRAQAALERMLAYEPMQYILGFTEFCGHRFNVAPGVLIPRPETEKLCEMAISAAMMTYRTRSAFGKAARPVRILDLCTGSGCIAWTLAAAIPGSDVIGVDISKEALEIASSQPLPQGMSKDHTPQFVCADIFDDEAMNTILGPNPSFDILVSNPPYICESERETMQHNVLDWEPDIALFVPDSDAQRFNRRIAALATRALSPDSSSAFIEINEHLGPASCAAFSAAFYYAASEAAVAPNSFSCSLSSCEIVKDFNGRDRFIKALR